MQRDVRTSVLLPSAKLVALRDGGGGTYVEAWDGYRQLILELAGGFPRPRLLEVGGGRSPLISQDDVRAMQCRYTVNDIDALELERAPDWVSTLHGDISNAGLHDSEEHVAKYDLIFAQMVFEHVRDPKRGYENICRLLAPGGLVVNFIPTLYAAPFVLNRIMPERVAAYILRTLFPIRNPEGVPKFPAYYRWCKSTPQVERKLLSIGFRSAHAIPFYGHDYYAKIPVLRTLSPSFWRLARRRGWRRASAYAYVVGVR